MADTKYDKMSHQELEAEMMRRQLKEQDASNSSVTFAGTFSLLWQVAKFAFYVYLIIVLACLLYLAVVWTGITLFSPKL